LIPHNCITSLDCTSTGKVDAYRAGWRRGSDEQMFGATRQVPHRENGQKALKPCRQRPLEIADQYANRCSNVPSCGGGRMLRFGVRTVQSTTAATGIVAAKSRVPDQGQHQSERRAHPHARTALLRQDHNQLEQSFAFMSIN
jgi:hypothetical protein